MRCLVSIPPVLRGESFVGSGESGLQQRLIRSWIDAGFSPVSMNTPVELEAHPQHEKLLIKSGVDVLEVPSSGGDYPPYLPNLRESLRLAAKRYPGEVIAITNADIHIRLDAVSRERLQLLAVDHFLLAHRSDVYDDSLFALSIPQRRESGLNSPFLPGIDFIAARAEALLEACPFLSPDLTIGLPWWDMLLPLSLFAIGATRSFLESVQFLHVKHEERWDPRWLDQVGKRATRHLYRMIKDYKAPASAYVWSLSYAKLVSPLQSPTVYKSRLLSRLECMRAACHRPDYLLEVLRMTEALVCEQGWDLDKRWIGTWYAESPAHRLASEPSSW